MRNASSPNLCVNAPVRPVTSLRCSIALTVLAVLAPSGWFVRSPSNEFEVVIRHFTIHYGTWVYELRPSGLTVSLEHVNDGPGEERCRVSFTGDTAAEWGRFLSTIPVDRLSPEYIGSADDYVQGVTFSLRVAGDTPRTIRAVPGPPDELKALCDRINKLIPEGCVKYPMYCGAPE